MEAVADKLSPEMVEGEKDAYQAQLAKSKAAKVSSAAKLLEKANKDPKVQKAIKKKPKGKGAGKGKSPPECQNADKTEDGKDGKPQESQGGGDGEEPVCLADESWPVKETPHTHIQNI